MTENIMATHNVSHQSIAKRAHRFWVFVVDLLIPFIFVAISYPLGIVSGDMEIVNFFSGILIISYIFLQIVLLVKRSQTFGKMFFNIYIARFGKNERCGFWRISLLRQMLGGTLVIGMIPLIGIFFQPVYSLIDHLFIFNEKKRTLHDLIGGTAVYNLPEKHHAKKFFDFTYIPKDLH
mgnify:CR=1 FL=1